MIAAMAALLLAGMGRLNAQRPVGDTLTHPSEEPTYLYMYDWSPGESGSGQYVSHIMDRLRWTLAYHGGCISFPIPGYKINGNQMYAAEPIKILGIAACVHIIPPSDTVLNGCVLSSVVDTTLAGRLTDSLILYKLTSSGPQLLAAGQWRMENPHRYLTLPMYDTARWPVPYVRGVHIPIEPLYEVMFDKPQVVTDSFIVAGTCNNNEMYWNTRYCPLNDQNLGRHCLWEHIPSVYWTVYSYLYETTPDTMDRTWLYVNDDIGWIRAYWARQITDNGTYWRYCHTIYPIIDPDFDTVLCDMARNVRVADSTDTTLTLMWNGGNAVQWEVVYAEVNSPTSYTVTTTAPMVTLTGLRERTNYMVRVRGMCEWDTEYGPWSDIVDVWTGVHHDTPVSISNLDRFTQMMPNPARGQVTVLSSYRLSRVVVYDLSGHSVLEHEDEGLTTTFDVSGLAKGVYVVAIHTPAGIATKRLVVE